MDSVTQLVASRPDFFANRAAWLDRAVRINDFIYMSNGLSNAYMLTTRAGRVIINAGMGFEAPTHKKVFDAVHAGPTPYILLTQGHVDHVGGVSHFREPRVVARLLDQLLVELDAQPSRAEFLRRRDHDPAVAGAEVDDQVSRLRAGKLQHALHHLARGGDERRPAFTLLRTAVKTDQNQEKKRDS